jgi:NAD(P)-dependent dehydrogenase (short-subunit alcohol dehydrogenase family)
MITPNETGAPVIPPGRVAVITGAASGIGLGLAGRLAADGTGRCGSARAVNGTGCSG